MVSLTALSLSAGIGQPSRLDITVLQRVSPPAPFVGEMIGRGAIDRAGQQIRRVDRQTPLSDLFSHPCQSSAEWKTTVVM
jgi:hypothetical protein